MCVFAVPTHLEVLWKIRDEEAGPHPCLENNVFKRDDAQLLKIFVILSCIAYAEQRNMQYTCTCVVYR